jgi:hypothetical protein
LVELLTVRELEVLRLMAEGLSHGGIAKKPKQPDVIPVSPSGGFSRRLKTNADFLAPAQEVSIPACLSKWLLFFILADER